MTMASRAMVAATGILSATLSGCSRPAQESDHPSSLQGVEVATLREGHAFDSRGAEIITREQLPQYLVDVHGGKWLALPNAGLDACQGGLSPGSIQILGQVYVRLPSIQQP